MPADIFHLVEAAHCSRRDIRASIRDDFETVSNLFNDFLLDRDPIRSGKNRRAGLLYSLGSEVYMKIFFFFSFSSFESLASETTCKNSSKCKNRMLNRFVREICVYFFYLYSKCIRVFFFSFSFFVYTCLCSMYLCISFDECIKDIRMTGLKDLHHAPA